MNQDKTIIELFKKTKESLRTFKTNELRSYDDVINYLITQERNRIFKDKK